MAVAGRNTSILPCHYTVLSLIFWSFFFFTDFYWLGLYQENGTLTRIGGKRFLFQTGLCLITFIIMYCFSMTTQKIRDFTHSQLLPAKLMPLSYEQKITLLAFVVIHVYRNIMKVVKWSMN